MIAQADLADRFARFLDREGFVPGDRIGSERSLAEHFGVPRSELRRALETFEAQGLVRRTMGSTGGVFRWDGKVERPLNTIESVPAMLRQQGFRASTSLLGAAIGLPTPDERRALRLEEGEAVLRLERRRDADDRPLSLDTMVLPVQRFPGLQSAELTGSVYDLLSSRYGVEPTDARETIDVEPASEAVARVLRLEPGAALFAIRRTTYDQAGRPFEYARDLFSAERTRITLRKVGARWKRVADR
jgi:GntR family transcriptional regulator